MKNKWWKLVLFIMVFNIGIAFGLSALAPDLPYLLNRLDAGPKKLFVEVNIPERALYLYEISNENQYLIKKYPCTVGALEYKTPEGVFNAPCFRWNPGWNPPESKWAEDLEAVEPGTGSPLGVAALTVSWEKAILIHGTANKSDLGMPASHGCIRLSNEDMTELLSYIQNNMRTTLGRADPKRYQENPEESYWGYFHEPLVVKLVYRRLNKVENMVTLSPDIYAEQAYQFPKIEWSSMLAGNSRAIYEIVGRADREGPYGQEYLSKSPYPYQGGKKTKKYYALIKNKYLSAYN